MPSSGQKLGYSSRHNLLFYLLLYILPFACMAQFTALCRIT